MDIEETFKVGAIFNSFRELKTKLNELELETERTFSMKNNRKFVPDENPESYEQLVYRYIHYWCPKSGTFNPSGQGIRNISSQKTKCPAFIKIKGDAKKKYLIITEKDLQHNHDPGTRLKKKGTKTVMESSEDADINTRATETRKATLKPIVENLMEVLIDSSTDDIFNEGLHVVMNVLTKLQLNHKADSTSTNKSSTTDETEIDNYAGITGAESIEYQVFQSENDHTPISQRIGYDEIDESALISAADSIERNTAQSALRIPQFNPPADSADSKVDLKAVVMPSKVQGKGRPQGPALTAIGLPIDETKTDNYVGITGAESIEYRVFQSENDHTPVSQRTGYDEIHESALISAADAIERNAAQSALRIPQFKPPADSAGSKVDLKAIIMPSKVQGKGRPRGPALTAIGLPIKRNVLLKFADQRDDQKIYDMLNWLTTNTALIEMVKEKEHLMCKADLDLKNLRDSFADESVDLHLLSEYFEAAAFKSLVNAVDKKKREDSYTCGSCPEPIETNSVQCDYCLLWYHYSCVGLKRAPRARTWFCYPCKHRN